MKRHIVLFIGLLLLAIGIALAGGFGSGPRSASAKGLQLTKMQNRILSGFAGFEFSQQLGSSEGDSKQKAKNYNSSGDDGCRSNYGNNVKVNQNCLNISDPDLQGRGQAENETAIAQNPNKPDQLVAGYNDYRRGDGTCDGIVGESPADS